MKDQPTVQAAETVAPRADASPLSHLTYTFLSLLLVAGVCARLGGNSTPATPSPAGPSATGSEPAKVQPAGLVELKLVPTNAQAEASATMKLAQSDQALLADAIAHRRLRLVKLPLFDAGAGPEGIGGTADTALDKSVQVSSGGYTTVVQLTHRPVVVTLPIDRVGIVSFHGAAGLGVGALTLTGPTRLPPLTDSQGFNIRVVAQ